MDTNTPTQAQEDQAVLAQREVEELLDRLIREGFDYRSIMAGAGAGIANSLLATAGPAKVSEWFGAQAVLTMNLREPIGR